MTDLRKVAEKLLQILDGNPESFDAWIYNPIRSAREELRQALAQPEQKPALGLTAQANGVVARLYLNPTSPLGEPDLRVELLYSEIPACNPEWVRLTVEEIKNTYFTTRADYVDFAKAIEAKLKEKNGG